ncbi:MAG: energy-coupling factor transporter transmembrane protein EcfT [Clostridiales bacterium]|nr:energy-coupling factor transporter transmembrane protein EcfT [Clostridiales bacterium]
MMNLTIGQYYPGASVIHRLDPRAKILLTLLVVTAVFLANSVPGYAALFVFVILSVGLSGVSPRLVLKSLKSIFYIVIFTFVLNLFFTQGGAVLLRWRFMTITENGLRAALYMALRLILLVVSTQLLTLTTSPIALTDGMERLMAPLSKLKFPSHELAMMMSIALRFIPTLLEETDKIKKAQMARGADFESGNLLRRARAMLPLLVPLFVSAFRRADELALAMEARCYRGGEHRTRMKTLRFSRLDGWAALVVAALVAVVAIF